MLKKWYNILALSLCMAMMFTSTTFAEDQPVTEGRSWVPSEDTERTRLAKAQYDEIMGTLELTLSETNPDYVDMMNNFIYGDVYQQSDLLDLRERQLITLVSLTSHQSYELLKLNAVASVNMGLSPEEVLEAVYHGTPYVGIATTYEAVRAVTQAFVDNGIELPVKSQATISDTLRFEAGNQAQVKVFGPFMKAAESEVEDGITKYVTEWCFGDFYTRGAIDLKTREMLTMCILANMGADQLGAHVFGTRNVGYSKEEIVAAITQCMPYMGTPLTLSAMETVEDVFAPQAE